MIETIASTAAHIGFLPSLGGTLLLILGAMVYLVRLGSRDNIIGPQPDPLGFDVPPMPEADDLERIPVGLDEAHRPVHLPLLYSHLLVAGVTRAGKGSVIWSLVLGVQPMVTAGLVRVWGIDGKGGMELRIGRRLFDFVATRHEDIATVLERAVASMEARTAKLAAGDIRKHTPTVDDPLIVIVIDELAAVTAYADPDIRKRIERCIKLILSQGAAPCISIVAATQDPRKETIGYRDLFPMRVALRTAEAGTTDLILGQGAREMGAQTHRISRKLPGVGYVMTDGGTPKRLRFAHITDEDIRASIARHADDLETTT